MPLSLGLFYLKISVTYIEGKDKGKDAVAQGIGSLRTSTTEVWSVESGNPERPPKPLLMVSQEIKWVTPNEPRPGSSKAVCMMHYAVLEESLELRSGEGRKYRQAPRRSTTDSG